MTQAVFKLRADENKAVVESFIGLRGTDMLAIGHDASGSRAIEALLRSDFGAKRKAAFFRQLQGHYFALCMNSFGSHVLETCWSAVRRHGPLICSISHVASG